MRHAQVRSVDTMQVTKDTVTSQFSSIARTSLCTALAGTNLTHIAICQPMDTTAQFLANGTTPAPNPIETEIQDWCTTIHGLGLNVLFRGTFCGIESLWGFPYYQDGSPNFLLQGTPASAPTDGETTWLGRIWRFITSNPGYFAPGDIFAPIPEPTTNAFNGHFFISGTGGAPTNFATFFNNLILVANAAFAVIGVAGVQTGATANNYSEIASGWIPASVFANAGMTAVDYYGNYHGTGLQPPAYQTDYLNIVNATGQPLFIQEWADLLTPGNNEPFTPTQDALEYENRMYKMVTGLVNAGKVTAYSYWGGWAGQNTSLLYVDTNGNYQLNGRGKLLASYFLGEGPVRVPLLDGNGNY